MENLPLSHTKRGKLLAAIGGLAGGPLGVIVSPLVLMLVNASKKEGNRFLIWALSGTIWRPSGDHLAIILGGENQNRKTRSQSQNSNYTNPLRVETDARLEIFNHGS